MGLQSLHGSFFERILMSNYNAPKWQGIKEVTIPEIKDEIEDREELTPEVISSLSFSHRLHANVISTDTPIRGAGDAGCATTVTRGDPARRPGCSAAWTVFGGPSPPPGCRRRAAVIVFGGPSLRLPRLGDSGRH